MSTATHPKLDLGEFKLGWHVLLLAALGVATNASGMLLYGFGVMVLPLEQAFGWGRAEMQVAMSFVFGGAVLSSQIAGWLNLRYGLRAVSVVSLVVLSLGYLGLTLLQGSIMSLYLAFALLPLLGVGTLQITWTQIVNLWYHRNRGLALSIILSGTGITAAVMPPLITWAISRWDWRAGFVLMAIPTALLTLPLAWRWLPGRESLTAPSTAGSGPTAGQPAAPITGMAFSQAVRSWRFWSLTAALMLGTAGIMGMVTNGVPMLRDKGMPAAQAAQLFGSFGLALVAGRVCVGYCLDRLWPAAVAAFSMLLPTVGCLLFLVVDTPPLLLLATVLVGIGAGAEFDLAAFLVARYFGLRDYGRIFGLHIGFLTAGTAIAPLIFASLFKLTGAYTGMLTVSAASFGMAAVLLLLLGRAPERA